MPNKVSRTVAKRPKIFVDLGSGDAGRSLELAVKRGRKRVSPRKITEFVAVDLKKPSNYFSGMAEKKFSAKGINQDNVYFRRVENARAFLRKCPSNRIKILNLDLSGATKNAREEIGTTEKLIELNTSFFKQASRTLVPNGRLYLTVSKQDSEAVLRTLKEAGFAETNAANLLELIQSGKTSTKSWYINFVDPIATPRSNAEISGFVRIVAIKRLKKIPVAQ